jgi:mannose-6-phosphate isomerase-like protein (cupin superfamily)
VSNGKLYQLVKDEILSFDRYNSGEIKVIGFPGFKNIDCIVKDKLSYAKWIEQYNNYSTIKVEGLMIEKFNDVHLFVNTKNGYSFKWHKDTVDVFLYVIKGQKKLQVKNKTYILSAGQGAFIPKGQLHRAFSKKDTWALSIGRK